MSVQSGDCTVFCRDLLHRCPGACLVELFWETRNLAGVEFGPGEQGAPSRKRDSGIGVRFILNSGQEQLFGFTTDVSPTGVERLVQRLSGIRRPAPSLPRPGGELRGIDADVTAARSIIEPHGQLLSYERVWRDCFVTNSDGIVSVAATEYWAAAVGRDGSPVVTRLFGAISGGGALESLRDAWRPPAVDDAGAKRQPVQPGPTDIVFSPAGASAIVHECGHTLEADYVAEGRSLFTGAVNRQIAADTVTIIDYPDIPGQFGSYQSDDEGRKASPTVLINAGVLQSYILDARTALMLDVPPTPNGRRESHRYPPTPRASNTYIAPGDHRPADIVASVDRGLYVEEVTGGQVDAATGLLRIHVVRAREIKGGKPGAATVPFSIVSTVSGVLRSIQLVGTDLEFSGELCGKRQVVPVTAGSPTILCRGLQVTS